MDEKKTVMLMIHAVAETIREIKEIPSGHLYACVMDKMSLDTYTTIVGILKKSGLVKEENHLLRWVEPDANCK